MIARVWHGRTRAADIETYVEYVKRSGVVELDGVEGCRGSYVLTRSEGDVSHILVISVWDSMERVRLFAKTDPEKAVYYPEDETYLLEREPDVRHYEIVHSSVRAG